MNKIIFAKVDIDKQVELAQKHDIKTQVSLNTEATVSEEC